MSMIVYTLMDCRPQFPYQPFYVGVGKRARPLQHLRAARSARKHPNPRVQEVIDAHFAEEVLPEIRTLVVCPDREYAWHVEKGYIKALGRKDIDKNGILCNLSGGGNDVGSDLPHVKRAQSEATKELNARLWADPEHRAARIAAMKGKKKTLTPEALQARRDNAKASRTSDVNEKRSSSMTALWNTDSFSTKQSVSRKRAWRDPSKRENMLKGRAEGIALSWQNPETRQRRIDGIKAALLRRNVTGD